jgi:heme exporter protein D
MMIFGMDLGPHWAFIVTSYLLAIVVVAGLIVWVIADHRIQTGTLTDLEARGQRRRSRQGRPPA